MNLLEQLKALEDDINGVAATTTSLEVTAVQPQPLPVDEAHALGRQALQRSMDLREQGYSS